jgi:hypothetical protein
MNEKLQEAIVEIITKAVSSAEEAGSFIVEQTPDVIQQLLTWKTAEALFFVGLSVVIGLLSILFFKLGKYYGNKIQPLRYDCSREAENIEFLNFFFYIWSAIFGLSGLIIFSANIHTVVYIWMAPKAYLIEYTAYLAK